MGVFRRPVPHSAHPEPNVGCVAPRRRTRSLLHNKIRTSPENPKPRAWLRHTPCLNGKRPSEKQFRRSQKRFSDGLCLFIIPPLQNFTSAARRRPRFPLLPEST
ncbi:hypothetical protein HMPREF9123_1823 [Neisseria bacilliformis ATCC BAA-1200]|uniref:Uncharacterized protein n=1 Tax=Neisseria bacilliformis ATCC BAA-1200 TaxID=888742 RepID=F2BDL7_9NEIS|nr:hypothetical protein HMPREF9123_1823 [Neisseria bacilliformis ATCC BAA-1200]